MLGTSFYGFFFSANRSEKLTLTKTLAFDDFWNIMPPESHDQAKIRLSWTPTGLFFAHVSYCSEIRLCSLQITLAALAFSAPISDVSARMK
jgi:hypothetical protein